MAEQTRSTNTNEIAENILVMRKVIASARKKFFYVQFGSEDLIRARDGQTVKWFTSSELTVYTADLADLPTERKDTITNTPVTGVLTLKGNDTTWVEALEITSVVDIPAQLRVEIAYNAGKTLDTLVRDVLLAAEATSGITHYFANGKTSATSTATGMTTADTANYVDIVTLSTTLKENDVPMFTHPRSGKEVYVAIITPRQQKALLLDATFRTLIQNGQQEKAWHGELGTIDDICFVVSTNTTTYTYNSLKCDKAIIIGKDLYGVPAMPGLSGQSGNANMDYGSNFADNEYWTLDKINKMFTIVVTKPGDGNGGGTAGDVYAVKSTLAWKAMFCTKILVAARGLVYVTYYGE